MIDFKGTNRWLSLSVALNLFLLGYVVAVLMRPNEPPPPPPPMSPALIFDRMSRDLSPEGQAVLRELIAANGDKLEELHAAMLSARTHAREVFARQPFDGAAFRAALDEGFHVALTFLGTMGEVLSQAGAQLSAEDRQRLKLFGPPPSPE